MAVVMIPMHIRFVVCGELTIPHLGLIYYCFYKRKIAMRNLGRPSRSDFVQRGFFKYRDKILFGITLCVRTEISCIIKEIS